VCNNQNTKVLFPRCSKKLSFRSSKAPKRLVNLPSVLGLWELAEAWRGLPNQEAPRSGRAPP
jgi:hypothetical protein